MVTQVSRKSTVLSFLQFNKCVQVTSVTAVRRSAIFSSASIATIACKNSSSTRTSFNAILLIDALFASSRIPFAVTAVPDRSIERRFGCRCKHVIVASVTEVYARFSCFSLVSDGKRAKSSSVNRVLAKNTASSDWMVPRASMHFPVTCVPLKSSETTWLRQAMASNHHRILASLPRTIPESRSSILEIELLIHAWRFFAG